MERLTKRDIEGFPILAENIDYKTLLSRLAEYEDMELTPEEFHESVDYILALNKKLKPYLDAEEQGLLIRLPCKVGDTVYRIWKVDGRESVISTHRFDTVAHIVEWLGKFGKTVFLTREEAEAALKEG